MGDITHFLMMSPIFYSFTKRTGTGTWNHALRLYGVLELMSKTTMTSILIYQPFCTNHMFHILEEVETLEKVIIQDPSLP